jgi:hypothetical protein
MRAAALSRHHVVHGDIAGLTSDFDCFARYQRLEHLGAIHTPPYSRHQSLHSTLHTENYTQR